MINALNSAVSGIIAQSTKISAGALNIANADVVGSLDPNSLNQPYQAIDVNITSSSQNGLNGGVKATVLPRQPGAIISYSPDSPFADKNGSIGVPNVNISEELVNNLQATQAYKASLQIIPIVKDLGEELLNAVNKKA